MTDLVTNLDWRQHTSSLRFLIGSLSLWFVGRQRQHSVALCFIICVLYRRYRVFGKALEVLDPHKQSVTLIIDTGSIWYFYACCCHAFYIKLKSYLNSVWERVVVRDKIVIIRCWANISLRLAGLVVRSILHLFWNLQNLRNSWDFGRFLFNQTKNRPKILVLLSLIPS